MNMLNEKKFKNIHSTWSYQLSKLVKIGTIRGHHELTSSKYSSSSIQFGLLCQIVRSLKKYSNHSDVQKLKP